MSFILSCDFWFCCGSANDPDCQQPYAEPTQPQTQVVTVMQSPGQMPPPIASNQLPPPLPAPALPPTLVYNLHPPRITPPSPHVPNREVCYYLPPPNMEKPAWPSTPSHVTSYKECNSMPQPATQEPPKAYDLLPQATQMVPSHHLPSSKVHEAVTSVGPSPQADLSAIQSSNTYQTPSFTNQQWTPPIVPPKRPETIVPTLVPMHTPAPQPSWAHNNPMQQSKQTALHTDTCDGQLQSHITSEPPPPAGFEFPSRQVSKTYQNFPSMNQRSMSHVPSKRYDNPVPDLAPIHAYPPVPSKMHETSVEAVAKTKSPSKYVEHSTES